MAKSPKRRSSTGRVAKVGARFLLVALVGALAVSAAAARPAEVIVLPGANSAEGIASGRGLDLLRRRSVHRRHLPRRLAARHGRAVHRRPRRPHGCRHGRPTWRTSLLFVAGGFTGQGMSTTPAPARPWRPTSSPHPRRLVHQRRRPDQGRSMVHRHRPGAALLRAGQPAGVPGPFRR